MAYREDRAPDHLLIKIEQPDHPVSVVAEDDARQRATVYPKLMWGAPVFGAAEQDGSRWRIVKLDDEEPQHARDNLASHFRRLHSELPETPEHASTRAEYVWGQRGPAVYVSPQVAREDGSFSMKGFVFDNNTGAEEFGAAYERARAAHQPPRTDDFEVDGVPCRVTRMETFVRFGSDGPEGPRPSDRDSYPPPARQMHDLRAKGLVSEPD